MFAEGFEKLSSLFDDMLYQRGLHSAAQVVVRRRGQVLVDHAAGVGPYQGIGVDAPFLCFSISKAFTGLCIHKLVEEGRVELDAPVAEYWPEFGCRGKETATIRHVFLHQAGIPAPGLRRQVLVWPYWRLVSRSVARTPAVFTPGSQTAYHLVNYGFIFGKVVERVTGMHVEEYLDRYFLRPLGLRNTWLRIPAQELPRSPLLEEHHPSMRSAVRLFNMPVIRKARIPAASLHSTARELAIVFQMLLDGGSYGGQRILRPETVEAATRTGYAGWDDYLGANMNWGLGFIIGGGDVHSGDPETRPMGRDCHDCTFGAFGMSTSMVWADRETDLVTAFTCNGMLSFQESNQRWAEISNAVWDGVKQITS